MENIIISGHGKFASGLKTTIELIAGKQDKISYIDFIEGMSNKELAVTFKDAIQEVNSNESIIFLTDLVGGTPFNESSMLSFENPNIQVIGGINLPLVVEVIENRGDLKLDECISDAQEEIKVFKVIASAEEESDGI